MLKPEKINEDLNYTNSRFHTFRDLFVAFATDVSSYFKDSEVTPGLLFALSIDRNYFDVDFVSRTYRFSYHMANTAEAAIIIHDVTDREKPVKKVECKFDGQGKTALKTHRDDIAYLKADGRHMFLHMLHEATKEFRT